MNSGLYFKKEELMETVRTNQHFDENAKHEIVRHEYSTGAVYEGQMKAGFIWPSLWT